MNKRQTGSEYEQKAAQYLQAKGVHVLELNYRNRTGEIDLIARDGDYLVFVEVKYRKDTRKGAPEEAVNYRKRQNICHVADYYRMTHGISEFTPIRYDVIAFCSDEVIWHPVSYTHLTLPTNSRV
mgnify:FL=1